MILKKVKYPLPWIAAVLLLLTIIPCCKAGNGDSGEPQTLRGAVDAIVNPNVKVGIMVGVIKNGQRHVFAYGSKNRNTGDLPNSDTLFEIGSITKTFTCIILAQMHLDGEVNLEDSAQTYHPSERVTLPSSNGKPIKLKNLATHTSGIPSMPDNLEEHEDDPSDPFASYTTEHMYEFLNNCTLDFAVGAMHSYSNCGMGLLGLTLALANGSSYGDLLNQKLLNVLGMTNTTLFLTEAQKQNLAVGHDANLNPTSNWNATDCLQGAGFIKSSLNDMFIYLEANMGLRSTPLADAIALTHEERVATPYGDYCGLGWYTTDYGDSRLVVNHNGSTGGYYAFIGFQKYNDNGVIVLSNSKYTSTLDRVGPEILKILDNY